MEETVKPLRFSRADLAIGLGVVGFAIVCVLPWAVSAREASRRARCANNMRQIGVALQNYHSTHQRLPYAARWEAVDLPAESMDVEPWTGRATHENWLQLLLSNLGETAIADSFESSVPVTDPRNAKPRPLNWRCSSVPQMGSADLTISTSMRTPRGQWPASHVGTTRSMVDPR